MNNIEFKLLTDAGESTKLSNEAKLLYLLVLRPGSDPTSGLTAPINYKAIVAQLSAGGATLSLGREINKLFQELEQSGLIAIDNNQDLSESLSGEQILLPLRVPPEQVSPNIHNSWSTMTTKWQPPIDIFNDICELVGLIQKEYDDLELGEFIAYWIGRPQVQLSPYQWTQKFVFHLRQKRITKGYTATQTIGFQQVDKEPEVVLNDKAKQLVERYRGKSEK